MEQHVCGACKNQYRTLSNLRKHNTKFHPDTVVPLRYNGSQNKPFNCSRCEKCYHNKDSLKRYIKTHHKNINDEDKENATATETTTATVTTINSKICSLCSRCYNFTSKMLAHFKDIHELPIRCEQFSFLSLEMCSESVIWKMRLIPDLSRKKIKTLKSHTCFTYMCHRSGNYLPEGNGQTSQNSRIQ